MANKDLMFRLFGEDKTASSSLSKLASNGEQSASRFQRAFGRTRAVIAGVGAVAAGAMAVVAKVGIDEALDAAAGTAQLEAGIKSTGGAAGVTVAQMQKLASHIQDYSGQTDDSISKTQSLLLTFTNIKNSGPNKIFDDTTKAAADMAARMGGDASQSAVMLGKALNDPVTGMAALAEVGVTFTEDQKKQAEAMVKVGDTAGAQKIILAELNKEFGGSAKAAGDALPGQLARVQRSFEDISQTVVEAFLPTVQKIIPVIQGVAGWLKENQWILPIIAVGLGVLAAAFVGVTVATWAMNTALLANPITWVVIGIVALIAVIALLIANWDHVAKFIGDVWAGVCAWLATTFDELGRWWSDLWNGIVAFGVTVLQGYVGFVTGIWTGIIGWIVGVWNGFVGFWTGLWNGAVAFGVAVIRNWVAASRALFAGVVAWLRGLFLGYLSFWRGLWGNVVSFVSGIPGRIRGFFAGIGGWLRNSGRALINGFIGGIRDMIGRAVGAAKDVVNAVARFFPHSPAPEGPFSGKGYSSYSGRALVSDFAAGMRASTTDVRAAAGDVMGAASGAGTLTLNRAGVGGPAGGGGAGGVQVVINLSGSYAGSKTDLAKTIADAVAHAVKSGAMPRGAFA